MQAGPESPDLEVQQAPHGAAQNLQSRVENRYPLSLKAAQYAHAVRNVLPGHPLREHDNKHNGDVRQMHQTSDRHIAVGTDAHVQHRSTSKAAALPDPCAQCERSSKEKAIVAEAARVKANFASVDAKTEVVLRFDFMNESDTKARGLQAELTHSRLVSA